MNKRFFIPFEELKCSIPTHNDDFAKFISVPFYFKIGDRKLFVCRQDGMNAPKPRLQELMSDCAMELLAKDVCHILFAEVGAARVLSMSDEEIQKALFDAELKLLDTRYDVPAIADLENQTIGAGTKCYDRKENEYVTFVGMIPPVQVIDGKNAIVRTASKELRDVNLGNLIPKYHMQSMG